MQQPKKTITAMGPRNFPNGTRTPAICWANGSSNLFGSNVNEPRPTITKTERAINQRNKPLAVLAIQGAGHRFISVSKRGLAYVSVSDTPVVIGYGIGITAKLYSLGPVVNG